MRQSRNLCIAALLLASLFGLGCSFAKSRPAVMVSAGEGFRLDLKILSVTPKGLRFEYSSVDVALQRTGHVAGFGARLEELDEESLNDESGSAYGAHDYLYRSGSCQITIRLTRDELKFARVIEEGCGQVNLHQDVFQSGLLRRESEG